MRLGRDPERMVRTGRRDLDLGSGRADGAGTRRGPWRAREGHSPPPLRAILRTEADRRRNVSGPLTGRRIRRIWTDNEGDDRQGLPAKSGARQVTALGLP